MPTSLLQRFRPRRPVAPQHVIRRLFVEKPERPTREISIFSPAKEVSGAGRIPLVQT